MSRYQVTAVQGLVLGFLSEEDRVTSVHLGKRVQLDSATLTGIIDRLELSGLITRESKPGDRRAILVCLTDKGSLISQKIRKEAMNTNDVLLSKLTDPEKETLLKLLDKLAL